MKHIQTLIMAALFVILLPNISKAQTAYDLSIEQIVNGNFLEVNLYITSTGPTDFALATSDFVFNVNGDALDIQDASIFVEGAWTKPPAGDHGYFTPSLDHSTADDWIKLTIEFKDRSGQSGLIVPSTATLLGTIRIPISNVTLNSEVSWNSALTIVRMVDPANKPNHPNITGSGTLINPPIFALPVELISFTAANEANNVKLDWATASEMNNSHFDVERSFNGHEWNTVGNVLGNGTSTRRHDYTFIDYDVNSSRNAEMVYYRLRQSDFDGAFEYSPVRVVSYSGENGGKTTITLSPNPATDRAEIAIKGYNGRFNATFYNTTGQQVIVFNGNGSQLLVPVSNLEGGIYIVRLTSVAGEFLGTQRLVINN